MIELVDFNEIYGKGKGEAKEAAGKKTRRAGGRKKAGAQDSEETTAPAKGTAAAKEAKSDAKAAE